MPVSAAPPPSFPTRQDTSDTTVNKCDFEILRLGSTGDAICDLQQRLTLIGYEITGEHYIFGPTTETALRQFQAERGLIVDGICGPHSWNALLEAGYRLGDRQLCYRHPMMRGDDIGDLQRYLSRLGFDTGWIDGIFGIDTQTAVQQFQHNTGLTVDGVVGLNTLKTLECLMWGSVSERTVSEVREHERLRQQPTRVEGRQVVVGDTGDMPMITQGVARHLRRSGAKVLSLSTPDLAHQASKSNEWGGDAYLGVTLTPDNSEVSYFATAGFESVGGRTLAIHCADALTPLFAEPITTTGMRLPILRETRMPAVCCRLGSEATVVTRSVSIASALAGAVVEWCFKPMTERC